MQYSKIRPSCRWNRRNRLKYIDIFDELYHALVSDPRPPVFTGWGPEPNHAPLDEVPLQLPELVHPEPNTNIINPIFAELSPTLRTTSNTSTPASGTQNTTPAPAPLSVRKRKRGRERTQTEETANRSETMECAAEIVASATRNDVSEALAILLRDFTNEPRKLSSDDMQIAIDFLSAPDKASIFLALSRPRGMEEHRDRWLERQAEVNIGFDSDSY
jgi:hypothetical protein